MILVVDMRWHLLYDQECEHNMSARGDTVEGDARGGGVLDLGSKCVRLVRS
jgi:hypothetical protein